MSQRVFILQHPNFRQSGQQESHSSGSPTEVKLNETHSKPASSLPSSFSFTCVSLPHPKHGSNARYLISNFSDSSLPDSSSSSFSFSLFEIQSFNDGSTIPNCSSWFVQNTIISDGRLYFATPVHIGWFLIRLLEEGSKVVLHANGNGQPQKDSAAAPVPFMQFDQLIDAIPEYRTLAQEMLKHNQLCPSSTTTDVSITDSASSSSPTAISDGSIMLSLSAFCDVKSGWDSLVYRINEQKVMDWIKNRVKSVAIYLTENKLKQSLVTSLSSTQTTNCTSASSNSAPASLSTSTPTSTPTPTPTPTLASIHTSLGIISEYLSPHRFRLLCASYDTTPEIIYDKKVSAASAGVEGLAGSLISGTKIGVSEGGISSSGLAETEGVTVTTDWSGVGSVNGDVDFSRESKLSASASVAGKRKDISMQSSSAAKKLAKVNTKGMKSMASFFGKK